jgi:cell division protein FtsL
MKISVARYRATSNLRKTFGKRIVSSKLLIPIIFTASIIILACLQVWQRVYVIGLVSEVSRYENENRKLTDLYKKIQMENIELSRLSRIEKIAAEKFGLEKTGAQNLFTLQLPESSFQDDGLDAVVTSLKKIADNLPVINETKAETIDIFDTDEKSQR